MAQCSVGRRRSACELRVLQQPLADRQCRQRTDCCLRRERTFRWPPPRCQWTRAAKRSPVGAALWQRPRSRTEQLVVLYCRYWRRGARTFWLLHTCGQKCRGEQRGRSVGRRLFSCVSCADWQRESAKNLVSLLVCARYYCSQGSSGDEHPIYVYAW